MMIVVMVTDAVAVADAERQSGGRSRAHRRSAQEASAANESESWWTSLDSKIDVVVHLYS